MFKIEMIHKLINKKDLICDYYLSYLYYAIFSIIK